MRPAPGVPSTQRTLPARSTIMGEIVVRTRLPGWMSLTPFPSGFGLLQKLPISLFRKKPSSQYPVPKKPEMI